MECTRRGYCYFSRLNIAYIRESASRYHKGDKSEATERTSICECGVIVVFLLLIEEKCPGCKMDSQGHQYIRHIGQVGIDAFDVPSIDRDRNRCLVAAER